MDVVEVAPAYDVAEITALAAATMVWEYLALCAELCAEGYAPPPKNALLVAGVRPYIRASPPEWGGDASARAASPELETWAQQRRKRVLFDSPGQPWAGVV